MFKNYPVLTHRSWGVVKQFQERPELVCQRRSEVVDFSGVLEAILKRLKIVDTDPISRNGSEARRSRFFCSLPLVPTLLRSAAPLPASQCCLCCERYWICSVSKRAFPFWCCSPRIAILVLHSFSFQRSLSLFGKTNSRDTFPTQSIVS